MFTNPAPFLWNFLYYLIKLVLNPNNADDQCGIVARKQNAAVYRRYFSFWFNTMKTNSTFHDFIENSIVLSIYKQFITFAKFKCHYVG